MAVSAPDYHPGRCPTQVVLVAKNSPANAGEMRHIGDAGSNPGSERWRRPWQPTPVFLPGESHG